VWAHLPYWFPWKPGTQHGVLILYRINGVHEGVCVARKRNRSTNLENGLKMKISLLPLQFHCQVSYAHAVSSQKMDIPAALLQVVARATQMSTAVCLDDRH
jgi:cation transport regulator ChaC